MPSQSSSVAVTIPAPVPKKTPAVTMPAIADTIGKTTSERSARTTAHESFVSCHPRLKRPDRLDCMDRL